MKKELQQFQNQKKKKKKKKKPLKKVQIKKLRRNIMKQ